MPGRTWEVWCGVGEITEKHELIRELTKSEAIAIALHKMQEWPRVLVSQKSAKYPRGCTLGACEYGRISGRIFEGRVV